MTWVLAEWRSWSVGQGAAFAAVVLVGLEILAYLVNAMQYATAKRIPNNGKHLDVLSSKDMAFISVSKLSTVVFTHHMLLYCGSSGSNVVWSLSGVTLLNTLAALPLLYLVYDFFYTAWHRFLHLRFIYAYVHKHHHQQHAPSRGNLDAINVHPVEFIVGEYDHLLSLYLVATFVTPVHVLTVLVFIVLGGFLASLNHTRFDVVSPIFPQIYQVAYHDIHHYDPLWNYGQYLMFWDALTGSFKSTASAQAQLAAKQKAKQA